MSAEDHAIQTVERLLEVIDLDSTQARTTEDIFTGSSHPMPTGRIYGGQVLAQALLAAERTLPEDRAVHSMHGYFLRPGDASQGITISVDRIHDGRSFSTRRAQAYQNGVPIFSMIASFQDADPGVEHAQPMPDGIPAPEELAPDENRVQGLPGGTARMLSERAADIRHVDSPLYLPSDDARTPQQAVWMRLRAPLPDDQRLHRAALAYLSDMTIQESILRAHGVYWATPVSRSPASITRCGGTGLRAWTSGCCTCRSRRTPAAAEGSPPDGSSRATGPSWRASPRRS